MRPKWPNLLHAINQCLACICSWVGWFEHDLVANSKDTLSWVKVQNFENPKLKKFRSQNFHYAYKLPTVFSLKG